MLQGHDPPWSPRALPRYPGRTLSPERQASVSSPLRTRVLKRAAQGQPLPQDPSHPGSGQREQRSAVLMQTQTARKATRPGLPVGWAEDLRRLQTQLGPDELRPSRFPHLPSPSMALQPTSENLSCP